MCRFVASLAQEGLKHRMIKAYLSGIRFSQIQHTLGNPAFNSIHRLEYVLAGIKRIQAHAGVTTNLRLPITLDILTKLNTIWQTSIDSTDGAMLWASACIGFFGFLRAGEFTVPSPSTYDPEVHLNLADIAIDSHTAPSLVCLRIKQSKTDPFREGVEDSLIQTLGPWKSAAYKVYIKLSKSQLTSVSRALAVTP